MIPGEIFPAEGFIELNAGSAASAAELAAAASAPELDAAAEVGFIGALAASWGG